MTIETVSINTRGRSLEGALQNRFWVFFGSIWLAVGLPFAAVAAYSILGQNDAATTEPALPLVFSFFGAFLSIAGGTILIVALRNARTRRRLLTSGIRTSGTVAEVTPMNLRVNGRTQWRLKYEYHDAAHTRHRRALYLDAEEASLWKPGDTGEVLFDPERPASAVWIGRTDAVAP